MTPNYGRTERVRLTFDLAAASADDVFTRRAAAGVLWRALPLSPAVGPHGMKTSQEASRDAAQPDFLVLPQHAELVAAGLRPPEDELLSAAMLRIARSSCGRAAG